MPHGEPERRTIRVDLPLEDDEIPVLRGALLAARATERAEMQRRGFRHSAGYGSESARTVMTAEVEQHRRRIDLLDRLIEALPRGPDVA
jgi:hypothetical protein